MNQLDALRDIVAAFDEAGIEHSLFGGWAVDFHAGETTRPHEDLDLAVSDADLPLIEATLLSGGWRHAPDSDEDGGTGYERDNVRLELTYVERWPVRTEGATTLELDGVRCRVVSLASLLQSKSDATDAKWRADYEVLRALPPRPGPAPRSSSR